MNTAVAKAKPEAALPVSANPNPMQMLQQALDKGMGPEVIKQMLDLKERWEAGEARKAYMEAVAAFKQNPPKIIKDMVNKQYNSNYTSLAGLVNPTNEELSKHGLSARWDINQSDNIVKVTCILSHFMGHSESVTLAGPPDTSGSKNPIQQIKSTLTYLKGATFEAVTGVASTNGNLDDDGNGTIKRIDEKQVADLQALIDEVGADKTAFLSYMGADSLENIRVEAFQKAVRALEQKRKQPKKKTA